MWACGIGRTTREEGRKKNAADKDCEEIYWESDEVDRFKGVKGKERKGEREREAQ